MRIEIGSWDVLGGHARVVRETVFVHEQNVPLALEQDDRDGICVHAVAFDDAGRAVATGRLLPDGHIGRMAVLKEARRLGLGGRILQALIARAEELGHTELRLNAQCYVEAFYRRYGFERVGEPFMEAGLVHIAMVRTAAPSTNGDGT